MTQALQIVIAALLALAPHTAPKLAERHARVILGVASDEEQIAALLVTGTRESEWRTGCVRGIGGAGTYGLGYGYWRWACAPLKIQAQMSLQAYHDKGAPDAWEHALIGYLGAKSIRDHEAFRRIQLFWLTKERLRCACNPNLEIEEP
jgi:hypothetical protein